MLATQLRDKTFDYYRVNYLNKHSKIDPKGFSSIDLLLWLAAISIALALVIPRAYTLTERYKFKMARNTLLQSIDDTRLKALQDQRDILIKLKNGQYQICYDDSSACRTQKISNSNIRFNNQGSGSIRFSSNGVVSPSTITLSSNHTKCELSISLRGRVLEKCS